MSYLSPTYAIYLFLFILLRTSPYLNGNVLKCTSHGVEADLFSQDLQICCTWNILYFEHNPPYTLSTFCMFISFLFSQPTPLPRSELLMHFRQAQQQQGSANANLQRVLQKQSSLGRGMSTSGSASEMEQRPGLKSPSKVKSPTGTVGPITPPQSLPSPPAASSSAPPQPPPPVLSPALVPSPAPSSAPSPLSPAHPAPQLAPVLIPTAAPVSTATTPEPAPIPKSAPAPPVVQAVPVNVPKPEPPSVSKSDPPATVNVPKPVVLVPDPISP